ncbi:chaperonin [Campylobacter sputorum subsp. bubulus]|uniref:Chaperonin n=1 Tax=Campylobacter sputorum subsp. sputorum TaxID=32024 RepID=A0A381DJW3_9BACT|nr:SMR family transporter [Campylobacter sputorum]ASM34333.1 multidrug efflux system protein, EmrE family [Campylobacter sputorum aubsp. sputorum RM3237]QEL04524.1 multidrug efflux system protein, EmrE family [Campylobacter sputorum subsp. sputorum]SUX09300.1 chaperonin [Campylobacter sputorum subsp. bubulus]SUX10993.1 chaperonin [Campylobacter sputorum subsp. sputorum]
MIKNKGLFFVIFGAILECGWVYGLKYANSNLAYLGTAAILVVSFFTFALSFKYLPPSVAYTLYIGLGTFFVMLSEIAIEITNGVSIEILRIFFVFTLLYGILGLKRC